MAKFDISLENCGALRGPSHAGKANDAPAVLPLRLRSDSTRMRARWGSSGTFVRGIHPHALGSAILACFLGVIPARADDFVPTRTAPDPAARVNEPPRVPPPSWDLDGIYFWIGPSGAASWARGPNQMAAKWDSTIGADATLVWIREHDALGALGGSVGAAKWTERGGGRLWIDAIVGSRIGGTMIGTSAGPILELNDLSRPKLGGSVGVWAFFGVTPYVRVGTVADLGMFAEVGLHLALPVLRHRH
jgi:hypothetical protein